jgi:hypothetical protein
MKKAVFQAVGVALVAPLAIFAQTILPSQDSYVLPGYGLNFGTSANVSVGNTAIVGLPGISFGIVQGLVQFDLSHLPAGITATQVKTATLTLFANQVATHGTINIYVANGPWTETGVTGQNAPSAGRRWRAALLLRRPTNLSRPTPWLSCRAPARRV